MFNITSISRFMCQELNNIWTFSRLKRCKKSDLVDVKKTNKNMRLPPGDKQFRSDRSTMLTLKPCTMITVNEPQQILSQIIIETEPPNRNETGIQTSFKYNVPKEKTLLKENRSTGKCIEDKVNMTDFTDDHTGPQPNAASLQLNNRTSKSLTVTDLETANSNKEDKAISVIEKNSSEATQTIRSYLEEHKPHKIIEIRLECDQKLLRSNDNNISLHNQAKEGTGLNRLK